MNKTFTLGAAALLASAVTASAFPLSYMNEAALTIPGWDRGPVNIGGTIVDPLTDPVISSFADAGDLTDFNSLYLDHDAKLEFTFIISEAANTNTAELYLNTGDGSDDIVVFNNKNATNPNFITTVAAGKLDFSYCTLGEQSTPSQAGCISNWDGLSVGQPNLKIASTKVFTGDDGRDLVFFFFGDGAGDSDLTDLVVAVQASAIPLPAGAWLLGTALAGLGFARRKRKS